MKIEQIIYETARNLLNLEDKLSIATLRGWLNGSAINKTSFIYV